MAETGCCSHSTYSSEAACGSLRIQNYRVWVSSIQLSDQWPLWPSGDICVCVCWEGEDVQRCHVGERTQGWRERCLKTFKEKNILFCINSLCQSLLIWEAVWILI